MSAELRAALERIANIGMRYRMGHRGDTLDVYEAAMKMEGEARAALAAKPDAEPQPVRERVDAPWNGHRAIETLRRMHAEESPARLVWECVPANIAAALAAKPDAGEGLPKTEADILNRLHDHGFTWDDVNALGAILDREGWAIVPVGTPDNVIAPDSMAVSRMNEAMKSVTASVQDLTDATNRGLRATTDETGDSSGE